MSLRKADRTMMQKHACGILPRTNANVILVNLDIPVFDLEKCFLAKMINERKVAFIKELM